MKRSVIAIALAFVAATALLAQESPSPSAGEPWKLLVFPIGAPGMEEQINEEVANGYMPVGVELEPGESLSVLLVQSGETEVDSWVISDHADWNALEDEITQGLTAGLVPMDISRVEDALVILWVRASIPVTGWRLHTAANTISDRARATNQFQSEGFTLWGISVYEDLAWFLFLKQPESQRAGTTSVYRKATGAITDGIVRSSEDGWLPIGLAATLDDYYVAYVR